jgi:hypothetical protein
MSQKRTQEEIARTLQGARNAMGKARKGTRIWFFYAGVVDAIEWARGNAVDLPMAPPTSRWAEGVTR